jgi:hypothetical protein
MPVHELLKTTPFGRGNIALWKLKHEVDDDRFLKIFSDLAQLIRRSEKACECAARQDNPAYEEFVAEVESDYLEELIGASFIVLQAKIRRVVSAAISLHDHLLAQQIDLSDLSVRNVRKLGGRYKRKNASLIELIWDVGNFYKHRDEWPHDVWRDKAGNENRRLDGSRRTRKSVERVGITFGSTGNMRTAYTFFDIDPFSKCERLAEQVQEWAVQVHVRARSQLKEVLIARGDIPTAPKTL